MTRLSLTAVFASLVLLACDTGGGGGGGRTGGGGGKIDGGSLDGGSSGGGTGATGGGIGRLGGGSGTGGGQGTGGGTEPGTGGGASDIDAGSGEDPIPDLSGNPTSYDLIDRAVTAGTLSEEQGALYKLFADFGSDDVPAQYRGDDVGLIEGVGGLQFTAFVDRVGEANVSTQTLDAARPYFVPPYYEGSWWNRAHPSATKSPSNPTCRAWSAPCSVLKEWSNVGGTHVVVWYETKHETVDGPRAAILAQEFDNVIWPKLTTLMGVTPPSDVGTGVVSETDARLDVVLLDLPSTLEGQTYTAGMGCKTLPSVIYLSRALPMHGLFAQGAHEMMHAIQFAEPVKARCTSDYKTLLDATAVWATNYVYPTSDWEHKYAKYYLTGGWFTSPYDSMPANNRGFAYGAYLFPLFLETKFGPAVVKSIWDSTASYSYELTAIDGALISLGSHFAKVWPDFVAANWNRDSIDTYRKLDRLTIAAELDSAQDQVFSLGGGGIGTLEHGASVEHAAATYYRVKMNDSSARSLNILNGWSYERTTADPGFGPMTSLTGLGALDREGAAMQIFFKVNGAWQSKPINLTPAPWLSMCRDNPKGAVEEMVFMYSNAEISESAPNYTSLTARGTPPGILATSVGCKDWSGTLSMTYSRDQTTETLTVTNAKLVNQMNTDAPQPGSEPPSYLATAGQEIPMGYGYVYSIDSGSATWAYNSRTTECTSTGNATVSLKSIGPVHTFSNFAPQGGAAHGLALTSFLGLANMFTINWSCTDSQGHVTSGSDPHGTNLDVAVDPGDSAVRITAAGLSVTGTQAQTREPAYITGTWSLTGSQ